MTILYTFMADSMSIIWSVNSSKLAWVSLSMLDHLVLIKTGSEVVVKEDIVRLSDCEIVRLWDCEIV